MRISSQSFPWHSFSSHLARLAPKEIKKVSSIEQKADRYKNGFCSFNPPQSLNLMPTISSFYPSEIDISLLEQFVAELTLEDFSYERFISSHLQEDALDKKSLGDMQKKIALKNLSAVIQSCIDEMKAIELTCIARTRG